MGSWSGFYVESADAERVARACANRLDEQRGWVSRLLGRTARVSSIAAVPPGFWAWRPLSLSRTRRFIVHAQAKRWIAVLSDAFVQPDSLPQALSQGTTVVDTMGQTTSDAYLVHVFRDRQLLRALEFAADEGWLRNEGVPLPGEPVPLESANEDDPEDEGWFDYHAVDRYLREVFAIEWWQLPEPGSELWLVEG